MGNRNMFVGCVRSPSSATTPIAVVNDTPRSACNAATSGAHRQVGVSGRSCSARRSMPRSVSSIASRYSCSAMCCAALENESAGAGAPAG